MPAGRVAWIDHAKGIGIILVVLMFSALGYDSGAGNWMQGFAHWARPMTVPVFFLISGLFLHRAIFGSAAAYCDRKILHLAYFFAIWLAIDIAFFHASDLVRKPISFIGLYLAGWVSPEGPIWFLQALGIFFVVTRLLRRVPANRVFAGAALLQVLHAAGLAHTGWPVIDHFAEYYVYFFFGYAAVPTVFQFAHGVTERRQDAARAFLVWLAVHTAFVALGIAGLPLVSLILGFAGSFAIIAMAATLAQLPAAQLIGKTGRNSLAIFLGFSIPMSVAQALLSAGNLIPDAGAASLAVAAAAFASALVFYRLSMDTPLRVLYVRPQMLHLKAARSAQRGSLLPSSPVTET